MYQPPSIDLANGSAGAPSGWEKLSEAGASVVRRVKKAGAETADIFNPGHYSPLLRHSMSTVGGAAVTAASSLAFGATIAEPLARIARETHGATPLFESIPWAGKFVNELLGKAGALGAMATAAPLLGLALTLVQSQGQGSDRAHWLLTHMAMGLSASPIWILPLAQLSGALPALLLAGACMVGVSVLLSERLSARQASVQMLLVGVSLVLGGAPLPALVATGTAVAQAATYGALVLSGGAAVLAGYTMYASFAALADDSTAELRFSAVKTNLSEDRLNLPDEASPNVFCFNDGLLDYVQHLKKEIRARRPLGLQAMMLAGPPGTGKTAISRAIGNALRAKTYLIEPSAILASDNPAQKVSSLFAQAKALGGRAVLFFDDAEALFPDRKAEGKFDTGFDTRTLLTTSLNTCLNGIERADCELLLVVLSSNNSSYLDYSIEQRFTGCDFDILPPTREQSAQVLQALFTDALQKRNGGGYGRKLKLADDRQALPQETVTYVLDEIDRQRVAGEKLVIVGRQFAALCAQVLRNMNVRGVLKDGQYPTDEEVALAFTQELPRFLDKQRESAEKRCARLNGGH